MNTFSRIVFEVVAAYCYIVLMQCGLQKIQSFNPLNI